MMCQYFSANFTSKQLHKMWAENAKRQPIKLQEKWAENFYWPWSNSDTNYQTAY